RWWGRYVAPREACAWRTQGGCACRSWMEPQVIDEFHARDEPDEFVCINDDGDFIALENRRECVHLVRHLHRMQPRGHRRAHRILELLRTEFVMTFDMGEDVAFVDDADDSAL